MIVSLTRNNASLPLSSSQPPAKRHGVYQFLAHLAESGLFVEAPKRITQPAAGEPAAVFAPPPTSDSSCIPPILASGVPHPLQTLNSHPNSEQPIPDGEKHSLVDVINCEQTGIFCLAILFGSWSSSDGL